MNRLLLIAIGLVVLGMAGFAVYIVAGGARNGPAPVASVTPPPPAATTPSAATPPAATTPPAAAVPPPTQARNQAPASGPAPAAPATPVVPVSETAAARAAFETWGEALRGLGLVVSAGQVGAAGDDLVMTDLDVAGPAGTFAWRWQSASARLQAAGNPAFTLSASGLQTLSLMRESGTTRWTGPLEKLEMRVQAGASRPFTTLLTTVSKLALQGSDGAPPLALGAGDFRINLGTGAPASAFRFTDLKLPAWSSDALGPTMAILQAEVNLNNPTPQGLPVRKLDLQWGALALTGAGSIGLDDAARPRGEFQVDIPDVLAALDGIQAVRGPAVADLAQTYATLLQERVTGRAAPFTAVMADGSLTLLGGPHGIADIPLAAVVPLVGAPPP